MNDYNHVGIIGRLTRDVELTYLNTGTALAKMSIATNRSIKQNDEWKDEVSFFNVILWGKRAEALSTYLLKGKQILIAGTLKQNRWEKDGQTRSRVEIVADRIQLLGGKKQDKNQGERQEQEEKEHKTETADDGFEDDIPF